MRNLRKKLKQDVIALLIHDLSTTKGLDRNIDQRIWNAFYNMGPTNKVNLPKLTESVDCVLTLINNEMRSADVRLFHRFDLGYYEANVDGFIYPRPGDKWPANLAIALLIAYFKSLA